VRAVAESEIPVISAVGHEIDWALCDFAADLRAPTPSAAAELVSAELTTVQANIKSISDLLTASIKTRIEKARLLLRPFSAKDLEYRFRSILQPRLVRFDDAKENLVESMAALVAGLRKRHELALAVLGAGNPLAVMERGFSMVINKRTGSVVRRSSDALPKDRLDIRTLHGTITAVTEECYGENAW
jgi:exodeoxyribonuclease VII large subunit